MKQQGSGFCKGGRSLVVAGMPLSSMLQNQICDSYFLYPYYVDTDKTEISVYEITKFNTDLYFLTFIAIYSRVNLFL